MSSDIARRPSFDDGGERALYRVLCEEQRRLMNEGEESFTISTQPVLHIHGRRFRPDFVISYMGKCAVIEVDGDTHRGRYAADRTRDYLLEEHGFASVRRIAVEDASTDSDALAFIRSLLRRLRRAA